MPDRSDDASAPSPARDVVELGHGRRSHGRRTKVLIVCGVLALAAGAVSVMVVVSDDPTPGAAASEPGESSSPASEGDPAVAPEPTSSQTASLATPSPAPEPPSIGGLPVGSPAAVPYWANGHLVVGGRETPWRQQPLALDHVVGRAVVLRADGMLLLVAENGSRSTIATDASSAIAVDRANGRVIYLRRLDADRNELVAWDVATEAVVGRQAFHDRNSCCRRSLAIRGILPDGSVLLDTLDWVRAWNPQVGTWKSYPLSGASAVRVLSTEGGRLLVREEHRSISGLELRTWRDPVAVGTPLNQVNEGLLSPAGRWLAVFSGTQPPYTAATDDPDDRTALLRVGASTNVVNAVWESERTLLLELELDDSAGDSVLVRCHRSDGGCERLPGDRAGIHVLPDGRAVTR